MHDRVRLIVAMLAPMALVAFAFHGLGDLRWAFGLYVFGGCAIVPAVLFGIVPLSGRDGLPWRTADERVLAPGGWPLAVVLFGPVFLAAYAGLRHVLTAPEPYFGNLVAYGWNASHTPIYLAAFLVLIPLLEEWWWRGQFLPRAERAFGARHGWWLSGVGFALYHVVVLLVLYEPGLALLRFAGIVAAGLAWAAIARRRRSWSWVYVAHLAADAVIVIAFLRWILPTA